jgi:putative membrane protein
VLVIDPRLSYRTTLGVLAGLFAIEFLALSIQPISRSAWILENVLVIAGVAILFASRRRLPLSRISYTLIFVFLYVHEVGSHYTYSLVPYDAWAMRWLGVSIDAALGFERNQFDRVVHLLYGLLLAYPIREVVLRIVDVRGIWGYLLPLDVTMSTSMIYELIEWGAAVVFGGDLGQSYLGTQGDIWDAHKDMALASVGAAVAMGVTLAINVASQRDFTREWIESLRVKHRLPLGEDALARRFGHDLRDENGGGN